MCFGCSSEKEAEDVASMDAEIQESGGMASNGGSGKGAFDGLRSKLPNWSQWVIWAVCLLTWLLVGVVIGHYMKKPEEVHSLDYPVTIQYTMNGAPNVQKSLASVTAKIDTTDMNQITFTGKYEDVQFAFKGNNWKVHKQEDQKIAGNKEQIKIWCAPDKDNKNVVHAPNGLLVITRGGKKNLMTIILKSFCPAGVLDQEDERKLQNVAVFAGSTCGSDPNFAKAASDLGKKLAANKIDLVYGGGCDGLMGKLVFSLLEHKGRKAQAYIPEQYVKVDNVKLTGKRENIDEGNNKQYVDDADKLAGYTKYIQHEIGGNFQNSVRMHRMLQEADASIALPGGLGTLNEVINAAAMGQINVHQNLVAVLNVERFYDPLYEQLVNVKGRGFSSSVLNHLIFVDSVDDALKALKSCAAPKVDWIDWPGFKKDLEYTEKIVKADDDDRE
eukprot:304749_1